MGDTSDNAELRMRMIFAIRQRGITNPDILNAIENTPRELFVDPLFKSRSFEDTALPIACGQTISQPSVVAYMTDALQLSPRCKVLEIGTGSGYQAAILAKLCRRLYTIERHPALAEIAEERLRKLGISNTVIKAGDGGLGWPDHAPFDRIILTAAAEDTPKILVDQLAVGGIMILPVGHSNESQQLIKLEKSEKGLHYSEMIPVRFVPLLEGLASEI